MAVPHDVLLDFCPDPVHGKSHQSHALVRVVMPDGFHEPDVAFLDQIAMGKTVAQIAARDRNDQPQMRNDERLGRIHIVVITHTDCQIPFFLCGENRGAVRRLDIGVEVPQISRRKRRELGPFAVRNQCGLNGLPKRI